MRTKVQWSLLLAGILVSFCFTPAPKPYREKVAAYYNATLDTLIGNLEAFGLATEHHGSIAGLKSSFLKCRNSYKQVSFFIEAFDARGSRILNGPDILRIEDDTQNDSMKPHGFQHIETLLYSDRPSYKTLAEEIRLQVENVKRLRNAIDHEYYFRDDRVWEALRLGSYRIISLGITGFDIPIALQALPETRSQLLGMQKVLSFYKEDLNPLNPSLFTLTDKSFDKAIGYIEKAKDFNSFDRLTFIKGYINPLSKNLKDCAVALGAVNRKQLTPLNPDAEGLFAADIFNIDFFSPNERYRVTDARIVLGKKLFSETRLSAGNIRSCASCHKPALAFTDGLTKAMAIGAKQGTLRNTPTLWNSALQARQFYDSRALVLETQLDAVVHSREEMGGSLRDAVDILNTDSTYTLLFQKAYPAEQSAITPYTIANAMASYIRTLISFNAVFDRYMRGTTASYPDRAKAGFNLFMGKAKCGTCHYAPMFNGLVPPLYDETESEIIGVPKSLSKSSGPDDDEGKYRHTKTPLHKYAFKTPTLRNIAVTAPYMHNGVFKTLEVVIDFYDLGGGAGRGIKLETQTLPADKLHLSKTEKAQLLAFLQTLTDTTVLAGK